MGYTVAKDLGWKEEWCLGHKTAEEMGFKEGDTEHPETQAIQVTDKIKDLGIHSRKSVGGPVLFKIRKSKHIK